MCGGACLSLSSPPEAIPTAFWSPLFVQESHLVLFQGFLLNNREIGHFAFHSVTGVVFIFRDELVYSLKVSGRVGSKFRHHHRFPPRSADITIIR